MFILGQSGYEWINVTKINLLYLEETDMLGHWQIIATSDSKNIILGEYDTEERAVEIREEILKFSSDYELVKATKDTRLVKENCFFNTYIMP